MNHKLLIVAVILCFCIAAVPFGLLLDRTTERYKTACEVDGGTFIDARNGMFCIKDKR